MCRVSLCVAFGRLEFFSLIICLFVSSDACVLKKRHERRDCRPWVLSYFFFRLCLFSFGWAFNIITKLMLLFWLLCRFSLSCMESKLCAVFFSSLFFYDLASHDCNTYTQRYIRMYTVIQAQQTARAVALVSSSPFPPFPPSLSRLFSLASLV